MPISNNKPMLKKESIPKSKGGIWKKIVFIFFLLLCLGGIFTSIFFYKKYQDLKNNPNLIAQEETKELVAEVSKIMELPSDETPTVATILDKEKLQDQKFFQKTENGDKLLVYSKAMKAILYRPGTHKIINVGPIVLDQQTANQSKDSQQQSSQKNLSRSHLKERYPRIACYNGTKKTGLAKQAQEKIKQKYPDYIFNILDNAKNSDYKKTLILDLSGQYSQEAKQIADLLGGEVILTLPQGENKPEADILVIVGKEK